MKEYRLPGGRHGRREYLRGVLQRASETRHEFDAPDIALTFQPDRQIFVDASFDHDSITECLRTLSFLNPHLVIEMHVGGGTGQVSTTLHYPDGLAASVRHRVAGQATRGEPVAHTHVSGSERVELALQRITAQRQHIAVYVNSCPCPSGHPLEQIFLEALAQAESGRCSHTGAGHGLVPVTGVEAIVSLWLKDGRSYALLNNGFWTEDDIAAVGAVIHAAVQNALA
jgi:DNA gyrase/topoisomerase IV subunit B